VHPTDDDLDAALPEVLRQLVRARSGAGDRADPDEIRGRIRIDVVSVSG
jgi:hypothetical protein